MAFFNFISAFEAIFSSNLFFASDIAIEGIIVETNTFQLFL
jgi:hypothetical protein